MVVGFPGCRGKLQLSTGNSFSTFVDHSSAVDCKVAREATPITGGTCRSCSRLCFLGCRLTLLGKQGQQSLVATQQPKGTQTWVQLTTSCQQLTTQQRVQLPTGSKQLRSMQQLGVLSELRGRSRRAFQAILRELLKNTDCVLLRLETVRCSKCRNEGLQQLLCKSWKQLQSRQDCSERSLLYWRQSPFLLLQLEGEKGLLEGLQRCLHGLSCCRTDRVQVLGRVGSSGLR